MITDILYTTTLYMLLKVGSVEMVPVRVIHCGGTTGQAETIRGGPGPERVRGYLKIIRYRVLGI